MAERVVAYLGLGGNVGDVAASMRAALRQLDDHPACSLTAVSRVYHTPPWGPVEQDWYLNACVRIETSLSAPDLLSLVLRIERDAGRVRETRWGPRTLDIDILLYGAAPVSLENLTIPHPRMTERAFVMAPLADIAGDLVLEGRTIGEHAEALPDEGLKVTDIVL
ncbi:2-amino-4-hydroxy-6-hydroxymethyldihydropteridine diphosphokinase [Oricola sp.]|uniref:2-amino-4-hydroxy-6- hydroxymethyldihydropteridine diphosphokinase n=1 Tax=Oricola sp. TaxID=1979950 RepID=UPI0025ECC75D|nr:2-amino-4-hydroxy-6-hydroxymethyldihydropteridine diphosphokinase [Oricola sp.]MCI5077265.1 2-amino-4-hydroxy-6-hydroxymethyldihydropteridine diphosphokinase [Oricola sp.]